MSFSQNNLNRSFSSPDIYSRFDNSAAVAIKRNISQGGSFIRNVFVEHVYQSETPTIVRHFSCEKIVGSNTLNSRLHNDYKDDIFFSLSKLKLNVDNIDTTIETNAKENKFSEENVIPMDIDISCEESKDHNYIESIDKIDKVFDFNTMDLKQHQNQINKNVYKRMETLNIKKTKDKMMPPYLKVAASTVIIFGIIIAILPSPVPIFDVDDIQFELNEKVYEQSGAINIIVNSLKQMHNWRNKIKVLSFVGTSGVGKTFVSNVLKQYYNNNVYEIYGSRETNNLKHEEVINSILGQDISLFIMDDLQQKDMTAVFKVLNLLPINQSILVITIFNIQYVDDNLDYTTKYDEVNTIREEFNNFGIDHEVVEFKEFDIHNVKNWIEFHLKQKNVDFKFFDKLVTSVLANHNVKHKGLKGVYSKILLEVNKLNYS